MLRAYEVRCTVCRLKHAQLLDAAHIQADAAGGLPVVPNGLAMCKIHHAAYDAGIVGVAPDYTVQVRADVLEEVDGPMLRHGLQDLHGSRLEIPRRLSERPDRELLAQALCAVQGCELIESGPRPTDRRGLGSGAGQTGSVFTETLSW